MNVMRTWIVSAIALIALQSVSSAATYTWTGGGGANTNWSSASNWGGMAPDDNETDVALVFPPLNGPYSSNNDVSGLHVISVAVATQLGDGNYVFSGTAITLTGLVTMENPDSGGPNLAWQIPLVLSGNVTIATSGRQTNVQGAIDLGNHTLIVDTEGDLVLAGVIGGSGNVIKNNTSALTITAANTYSGSTMCNGGALYISNASAFGASATGTTFNGGLLGFFLGSTFTTAEPFVFNAGGIITYGTPAMSGPVLLNATINIRPFEAASVLTISGTVGGAGGINKTGPGLLVLNAPTATYDGATSVDQGTLRLDAVLSSSQPVTVKNGATLMGNGASSGTVSVREGGRLAPGSSPGQLSVAALSMAAGSVLAAEIDGKNPITQYDSLAVSDAVSLNNATLNVTLGFTPSDGQPFTLISRAQNGPTMGTFAGLPEGAIFQVGTTTFGITYSGGTGNDVVLVAGPPHTPTSTATSAVQPPTPTSTPPHTATSTATGTAPAIATTQAPTATQTGAVTATHTAMPTFTAVATTPTPTATPVAPPCTGDCDGDGAVAINELLLGVNIALGNNAIDACPPLDADGDGGVSIAELIDAVGNALTGCPPAARAVGQRDTIYFLGPVDLLAPRSSRR